MFSYIKKLLSCAFEMFIPCRPTFYLFSITIAKIPETGYYIRKS